MSDPLRVGIIDFLNSMPLHLALERGDVPLPAGVEVVKGTPTELNALAARGALDVSMVSSIHYARDARNLTIVPGVSIQSQGFVHSVELFYKDDLATLEGGTIAVTPQSATSEILLKILLARRFGFEATIVRREPDLDALGRGVDGALLIGDGALEAVLAYPNLGRRDLGLEWAAFAGAPMVFALLAARRGAPPARVAALAEALERARQWARAHRPEIVDAARARSGLPAKMLDAYFRTLTYDLDEAALVGLGRFYAEARALGEIDEVPPLPLAEARR